MTDLENLVARRTEIIAALSEAGTAPDYSIDGQSVQRSNNRAALLKELDLINKQISIGQGPFIYETEYR